MRGRPPDERRRERQARAGPLLNIFRHWLDATGPRLSRRSDLAVAVRYALTRWPALTRYAGDGHLEIDNNAAERSLRGIAVGRKNWLFAGSDQGGHRASSIYSLVETTNLNGVDPKAWLTDIIAPIADHSARRVAELIPRFDGAILSLEWKEAVWDKYVTGAPRPRTPSEQQYSDRKLRSRR